RAWMVAPPSAGSRLMFGRMMRTWPRLVAGMGLLILFLGLSWVTGIAEQPILVRISAAKQLRDAIDRDARARDADEVKQIDVHRVLANARNAAA
ncbi:MAG: hypothetical protein AAFQ16_10645, partial [Pseudomonadota bacterium]